MAMRPCEKCGYHNWKYRFNDDTRKVTAICKQCKNVVSWKTKPRVYVRKSGELWCEYKHKKDGKRFLRTNDNKKWREVGLKKGYKKGRPYLQVVPVKQANFDGVWVT